MDGDCFPGYEEEYESTGPLDFGPLATFVNSTTEIRGSQAGETMPPGAGPTFAQLQHYNASVLGTVSLEGYFAEYSGGGYVMFIPRNASKATRQALGPLLTAHLLEDPDGKRTRGRW